MAETQTTFKWQVEYWNLGDSKKTATVEAETEQGALEFIKAHDEYMFAQLDQITLVK